MSGLTTHVLDTSIGKPAYKIFIELFSVKDDVRHRILECFTNKDGRVDSPLMSDDNFNLGEYELVFHVKDYFLDNKLVEKDYAFFDRINIRFSINQFNHYHIPLLVSPYSYSTYRGS